MPLMTCTEPTVGATAMPGLGQDDVAHLLQIGHGERAGGLHWPRGTDSRSRARSRRTHWSEGQRQQAATRGLTSTRHKAMPKSNQEKLHQKRRALEEFDVPRREQAQHFVLGDAAEQDQQSHQAAADQAMSDRRMVQRVASSRFSRMIAKENSIMAQAFRNRARPMPRNIARMAMASSK